MPTPRARDVDVGLRLRLWEHPGEGPVVLFLHGYLDTGRSYDDAVAALGGSVRALCLDWRGHGESERAGPGGSYHLLDHLKDLAGVLAHLEASGERPELVVAHSMGGNVAFMLAGALPDEISRLLLLDALGPPAEDPEAQVERLAAAIRKAREPVRPFSRFASVDDARARLRALNPGLSEVGAERMARHALIPDGGGGYSFAFDGRLRGPTPVRYPEAMWLTLAARVKAHTVIIRAEHGYVPEGEPATSRVAAMPSASLATWEGVGHHLHVEAPVRLAAQIKGMLTHSSIEPGR